MFSNDSTERRRRTRNSTLTKMIILRFLTLIIIISKCFCGFLRPEMTGMCIPGKVFILRMHI